MKGKRVPHRGIVEVNIIDEDLTRLLLFEQGGLDFVQLRGEIATRLLADGKLKPEYAARGITRQVVAEPFLFSLYFNIEDPVVGGMTNERIALRRAIALGWDTDTLIKIVLAGQAIPANQIIPPGVGGHDPDAAGKVAVRSRHRERAARPLRLRQARRGRLSQGARRLAAHAHDVAAHRAVSREMQTLWKKNMDAIGLRTEFRRAVPGSSRTWKEGKFQMYQGGFGGSPSGYRSSSSSTAGSRSGSTSRNSAGRIRPRRRQVPAQRERRRASRRRAQNDRARPHLHAGDARDLPPGERLRSAVAAGFQPTGVLELLEISGHRSRAKGIRPLGQLKRCGRSSAPGQGTTSSMTGLPSLVDLSRVPRLERYGAAFR